MAAPSIVAMSESLVSGGIVAKQDEYFLNRAAKYLARTNIDERHNHGQYAPGDPRGRICEAWRFPWIDGHHTTGAPEDSYRWNEVTFLYPGGPNPPGQVAVVGTFASLAETTPLSRLADTPYFAATVLVPKGQVHTYVFLVDGRRELDPVNPQTTVLDNGRTWSRFFTDGCTERLSFEPWEMDILRRLTDHILPFRTPDAERFLAQYYQGLDRRRRDLEMPWAYRFDDGVGVANFIDKLVAREENHHLGDYKICLGQIRQVLRARNPFVEPARIPKEMYIELYDEMGSGTVPGWDYGQYNDPRYFLRLLRRHALTGAFSHPRYGGNDAASAWEYLAERYRDANGTTLFNWRQAIEKPLGINPDYRG